MHSWKTLPILAAAVLLAACSDNDSTVDPGPGGSQPPVIQSFTSTQAAVEHGEWTQLRWTIEGATVAAISPGLGEVPSSGAHGRSVRPARNTTYEITASNAHGTVSATVSVSVSYPTGIFVDPTDGDDTAAGRTPDEAVATLGHALAEIGPGESIFLAHGIYDANVVVSSSRLLIFGGLDPSTFFQGTGAGSWIQPSSGIPVEVTSISPVITILRDLKLRAPPSAVAALKVTDAQLSAVGCTFDGTQAGPGTAILLEGDSDVEISHSRIHGGGTEVSSRTETRGLHVTDTTALRLTHCFVSGGSASFRATGVDLHTTGAVTLGLNTIMARITGGLGSDNATAIRIWNGSPAIGGNILFTRSVGAATRHAVVEEAPDADPSWFESNLLMSAGTPAYANHFDDGPGAFIEAELNNFLVIIGSDGATKVSDNRLVVGLSVQDMFKSIPQLDFHLREPLGTGSTNPAVNGGLRRHDFETYGSEANDIDGDGRPGTYALYDRGADEI